MIDEDLASLYGVDTRVLNQAVKRNIMRFPSEFMFQLMDNEINQQYRHLLSQSGQSPGVLNPDRNKYLEITNCDVKLGWNK